MSALVQIGRRGAAALDDAAARAARAERWKHLRPTSAQLYVENRCHLSCAHCYESEASHPPLSSSTGALTLAEYEKLFDELAELGVLYLTFTGGEIFLRKNLLDIVAAARKRRFAVTLYTSGTLIDEGRADALAALKVSGVHVSVYSHEAAVHDAFTGVPGSHGKSLRALRLLRERGVTTVMKSNLTTFNVDFIDEWIALAVALGADWQLDPTVKPRMDGDRSPLRFAVSPERVRRLLERPELYAAFRRTTPDDLCSGDAKLVPDDAPMCGAARAVLSIAANGDVHGCGFHPVVAGNVRERRLADVWAGAEVLDALRRRTVATMDGCSSCGKRATCSPCMAYAHVEHGSDGGCASSSRQMAEALLLLARRRVDAERKMAGGRPLPILGDASALGPPSKRGRQALSVEE